MVRPGRTPGGLVEARSSRGALGSLQLPLGFGFGGGGLREAVVCPEGVWAFESLYGALNYLAFHVSKPTQVSTEFGITGYSCDPLCLDFLVGREVRRAGCPLKWLALSKASPV